MKQFSFCLKNMSDYDAWLQSYRDHCPQTASAVLVFIFSGWEDKEELSALMRRLDRALPDAVLVGCTTAGEIMEGAMSERTTVLNCMFFDSAEAVLHEIDFSKASPEDAAASLVDSLRGLDVAGVGLLVSENGRTAHKFLSLLRSLPSWIPVFGAIAGSTGASGQYVFTRERAVYNGVVAICFLGSGLYIHTCTSIGWRQLGPSFLITRMEGDNVIVELDGKPASYIYQKYLAMSRENISNENLLFPLCTEREGSLIMRLPSDCLEDGSLVISGDCSEGESVRLAFGDPGEILNASYHVRFEMASFAPEAVLLLNCVSRRFFLHEDANQELAPFRQIAPNAGFYVHGEINRNSDGDVLLLNMSMVSVCFREGAPKKSSPEAAQLKPPERKLTDVMKLVQFLANFVAVTSEESENANRQLSRLATIDRLTGLYNRGEIETILRRALIRNRASGAALSAIMIDLDDFKRVNDIFGHAMGDATLQWSASVIRDNIRESDAAGRWGGEEFFVILSGASLEAAERIAERIRKAFEGGRALPNGGHVTASFGVATFPEDGDYMGFYKQLDEALYRAKQEGKNRVCVAGK